MIREFQLVSGQPDEQELAILAAVLANIAIVQMSSPPDLTKACLSPWQQAARFEALRAEPSQMPDISALRLHAEGLWPK